MVAPLTAAKGSTAIKPLPPTKNNVAFDNWYQEAALTNVYDFSTAVNANITLYAKWITVTRETLQTLFDDSHMVNSSNYTRESYEAMVVKRQAAYMVLQSGNPTTQQIVNAYTELSVAMNALVALPRIAVVDVSIRNVIDGVVYINQGQSFNLYAYAIGANGEDATDRRVLFSYNAEQLATLAEGDIHIEEASLWFYAKSTLTPGTTVSLSVKSAENPAIFKTITLKVAGQGEIKTMFINAVNALPTPDKIEYKHYDAITMAFDIYQSVPYEERQDAAIEAAYRKLNKCYNAYYDLPQRMKYSFKGNLCTLIELVGLDKEEEADKYIFAAAGTFPAGTYTQNGWDSDGKDDYYQKRITLKNDGTGIVEYREAKDANGTEATEWEEDETFTYTNQGTQAAGGMLLITFNWDDEEEPVVPNPEPGVKSVSSVNTTSHKIMFTYFYYIYESLITNKLTL